MLLVKHCHQTVDACVEQSYLSAWLLNTLTTTTFTNRFTSVVPKHIITILHTLFWCNVAMIIHHQMVKLFFYISIGDVVGGDKVGRDKAGGDIVHGDKVESDKYTELQDALRQ